jgi:hypothetical protein
MPVLPSLYLRLRSISLVTGKNGVGTGGSSMTLTLLALATGISPTNNSNPVAVPLRGFGEQCGESAVSTCERPGHTLAVGVGEAGFGYGHAGLGMFRRGASGSPIPAGITKVAAGRPAVGPPGGGVSTRPATPAAASRAAEGQSAGPRSALDAAGERRGIRRLAATTAGPWTGAGSRPRRRRRGRSRSCELSRRSRTAYRVCRSGLRSCSGCCCLVRSVVLVGWVRWSVVGLLVVLLVLGAAAGWPVSFTVSARGLAWATPRPLPGAGAERWWC